MTGWQRRLVGLAFEYLSVEGDNGASYALPRNDRDLAVDDVTCTLSRLYYPLPSLE